MNTGTILRTIARIAVSLNTAVLVTSAMIGELGIAKLTFIWGIITILCDFTVSFVTTYYNNDYTPEAEAGTNLTRYMKATKDYRVATEKEPDDSEVK